MCLHTPVSSCAARLGRQRGAGAPGTPMAPRSGGVPASVGILWAPACNRHACVVASHDTAARPDQTGYCAHRIGPGRVVSHTHRAVHADGLSPCLRTACGARRAVHGRGPGAGRRPVGLRRNAEGDVGRRRVGRGQRTGGRGPWRHGLAEASAPGAPNGHRGARRHARAGGVCLSSRALAEGTPQAEVWGARDLTSHWSRRQQPPLVPRSGCWRGSPRALGAKNTKTGESLCHFFNTHPFL